MSIPSLILGILIGAILMGALCILAVSGTFKEFF